MYGRNKAFTLTEAVLTIVIMGILAMVVLPHFVNEGFVGGLTLRTATSGITADIRYTRQLALTNSGHYLIKFDFNQRGYNIYKDDILPENQVGEVKKISSDIALSGTDQFDFYPMGNCLFSGEGLSLFLSANQYRIIVEPPSGAVVIEKIS